MKPRIRLEMLILAAVPLIMVLGNTMLFPVFPAMRQELGISAAQLGWLTLAISLPSSFIAPFTGRWADSIGRKVILLPSLLLYGLGGALAAVAAMFWEDAFLWILIGRVVQGLGSGGPMHLSTVLAGDIFQSKERAKALGLIETANGVGKVISPILGSIVGLISWWAVFWVYPILALPLGVALWQLVREPNQPDPGSTRTSRFHWELLLKRVNILGLLSGFLSLFSLLGVMFWLSDFLATHWEIAQGYRGLLLAIPVAVAASISALAGFFQRFGAKTVLSSGLCLVSFALALMPLFAPTNLLWALLVVLGLGTGLILPALDLFSTSLVDEKQRATLTSLYSAFRSVGAAVAPFTIGYVLPFGLLVAFWPLAFLLLVVAMLILWINNDQLPDNLKPASCRS